MFKTIGEINERLTQIAAELRDSEGVDIDALTDEVDTLEERKAEMIEAREKRSRILERIAAGAGDAIPVVPEERGEEEVNQTEYRNAYLKRLMGRKLTDAEERAYIHTTDNTAAVIPTVTEDKIYSALKEEHPILSDIETIRSGAVVRLVKHISIDAGDAKKPGETNANDDEQNTFVNVTLSGQKYSKHVRISFELENMSIDSFEAYLVSEIAQRLGAAIARDVVLQVKEDMAAGNKAESADVTLDDVMDAFGKLKAGQAVIYANNTTIWGQIARIKGDEGRTAFVADPTAAVPGRLLGRPVKQEDAVADNEVLVLIPKDFLLNEVAPVTMMVERDATTGDKVIAGHTITDGTLLWDNAAALITVGSEGV